MINEKTNILILSAGTRNKIIQYFKENINGNVIATDCSNLAPALYEADKYYIVQKFSENGYIDQIIEICKKENVNGILSLIDPELELISRFKDEFLKNGIIPLVNDEHINSLCFDKYLFYKKLTDLNINTVNSYDDIKEFMNDLNSKIHFPVFIKPKNGSASIDIAKVDNLQELDTLINKYNDDYLIQEYIDGIEIGIDVYIDRIDQQIKGYFAKEKIRMRAGETDKSVSYVDEELKELIYDFCYKMGFTGVIDIDVFKINDKYLISEVNPRFGGGYPHAYEAGINFPEMIVDNLSNKPSNHNYTSYEDRLYMSKYSELKIFKVNN